MRIEVPRELTTRGLLGIHRRFFWKKFGGSTVTLSAEVKGENLIQNPGGKYGGSKLVVSVPVNGERKIFEARAKFGTFDWTRLKVTFPMPQNGDFILALGTQMSTANSGTGICR